MRERIIPERIQTYLDEFGARETESMRRVREASSRIEGGRFAVAQEAGPLLAFLIEVIGARRTLDIGTFTGYSGLCAALAVGESGRVHSFEKNAAWAQEAERHWTEAGVRERIELHVGPALESLSRLLANQEAETFDFAFIDADKRAYSEYFETALALVRRGGLIVLDNVLWRGIVADPQSDDPKSAFFRDLNRKLHADTRISLVMLPVGDGVTLARKH